MTRLTRYTPFTPGKEPPAMALRPVCPGCGEKLRPFIHGGYELPREWHGTYKGYGAFCSLVCTEGYANYMYKKHGTMLIMVKK